MFRPQTLADVAQRARAAPPELYTALNEFADEFYLDHPDKRAQQRRIDPIPESVGEPLIDALIGAVGDHLAQRWGLSVPDWTQRPVHFALEEPRFLPDSRALRGVLFVESPPAFRSRLLFTGADALDFRRTLPGPGSPWTGRRRWTSGTQLQRHRGNKPAAAGFLSRGAPLILHEDGTAWHRCR